MSVENQILNFCPFSLNTSANSKKLDESAREMTVELNESDSLQSPLHSRRSIVRSQLNLQHLRRLPEYPEKNAHFANL